MFEIYRVESWAMSFLLNQSLCRYQADLWPCRVKKTCEVPEMIVFVFAEGVGVGDGDACLIRRSLKEAAFFWCTKSEASCANIEVD